MSTSEDPTPTVACLREMLKMAESGEIIGLYAAVVRPDHVESIMAGIHVPQAVEMAMYDLCVGIRKNHMLTGVALDLDSISPGVRDLVAALRAAGLHTTDSGDGSHAAGMECALPFPHVFIMCHAGAEQKTIDVIKRVLAAQPDLVDWPVDVEAFDPAAGEPGCVAVWHADRDAICKRVGYEWGPE